VDLTQAFVDLAIALGLGLLVGLQRERSMSRLAGLRTFAITTLLGSLCGLLAATHGGWVIGAGLVSLAAVILAGNWLASHTGAPDTGLTTEVAMLAMFGVGALLATGPRPLGVALGAGVAVLLQFKGELHGIAKRLGDADLKAIMQFALVWLVILPALPDETFGPFDVLNPRQIWFMVVLIVGVNLAGYLAGRMLEGSAGTILTGFLGGLVSSTATTASYSRLSVSGAIPMRVSALVILLASTVVFLRLLVEMLVVSRELLRASIVPCLILLALMAALSLTFWRHSKGPVHRSIEGRNPTELRWALAFGLIYATVLFAVAAVKQLLGGQYLYAVAAISGVSDVDAITLSTAQMVNTGKLDAGAGWRLVVVAAMSNLVSKLAIVGAMGERRLFTHLALLFLLVIAAGVALVWLLP
jgi:uncharacterized membrane protein (DUF4010 family)